MRAPDPRVEAGVPPPASFLQDALRYPDRIVAFAIAAFALGLLVAGWMLVPLFPGVALLQRAREDWLSLMLVPVAAIVGCAWLNTPAASGLRRHRWNAAVLLVLAVVFLWRVLWGAG